MTAWLLEGCGDVTLDKQNMTDCAAPGFLLAVKPRKKLARGMLYFEFSSPSTAAGLDFKQEVGPGKHMTSF